MSEQERTAVVIAIGDELLSGETVDTNSNYVDTRLEGWGWTVIRHIAVPDDEAAIADAYQDASRRARLVVSTGGMGPTMDDLTLSGLARALGRSLVLNEEALADLERKFARFGVRMTPNNRRQVMVPETSEILTNEVGSAPCVTASLDGATVFALPGVPSEVRWLFENRVGPRVEGPPRVHRRVLRTIGLGESRLESQIRDAIDANPTVKFGFRTLGAENQVKLAAEGPDAVRALDEAEAAVRAIAGDRLFGSGTDDLAALVGSALKAAGHTVSTAESCTGGLVAKRLTDTPGSSAYVVGGIVAYANQIKVDFLGVDPATLDAHGAVSEEVARQMALGVRGRLKTDWGLSATGVAGPGGGTPEKPVGLVWIGLAGPDGVSTRKLNRPGNRDNIRDGTAKILLHWLLNAVRGSTS